MKPFIFQTHHPPQAIFTSFKLERNDSKGHTSSSSQNHSQPMKIKPEKREPSAESDEGTSKIQIILANEQCSDISCVYKKLIHYHCSHSKFCHYSTNQLVQIDHHLNDFHQKMEILENYDYFDRNYDCKLAGCCYNKVILKKNC